MLLCIITPRKTCISKLSLCCTDEASVRFHVLRLEWVLNLQKGIFFFFFFFSTLVWQTEQIKHNKLSTQLNLKVMLNSEARHIECLLCVRVYSGA